MTPTTPLTSIGNGSSPNETARSLMQPLNEEEVVSEPIPLPPPEQMVIPSKSIDIPNIASEIDEKVSKEKSCAERSDSGFSDCSNSSNGNTNIVALMMHQTNVATAHPLLDKINSISEEKSMNEPNHRENDLKELGNKVSVNLLKMKLEKMAESQQLNTSKNSNAEKKMVKKLPTPITTGTMNIDEEDLDKEKNGTNLMRTSYSFDLDDVDSLKEFDEEPKSLPINQVTKALMRSASLHKKRIVEKEPIMKSDFTNTIKMRKKSLENNVARQVHPQRILLEPSGKVSKLLRRFDSQNVTANDSQIDAPLENEPIVQTPDIDGTSKKITGDLNKVDDEILEIFMTKNVTEMDSPTTQMALAASAVARKSPVKIAKTIVSSGSGSGSGSNSMRRAIATKQYTNTKTHLTSMEMKVITQRKSPTKLTNDASNTPLNRVTPKAINNQANYSKISKKSHNKSSAAATTVDAEKMSTVQRTSRKGTTTATSPTITNASKSTAYSSFNRTSPIRLSGRVKEVTDRLSTSKAIVKATSPVRDRPDKRITGKNAMTNHQNMAMKSMSGKIVTVSEAIIETEQHVEHTINGKIDGTFTLKSKMNENFRKASAFWKST